MFPAKHKVILSVTFVLLVHLESQSKTVRSKKSISIGHNVDPKDYRRL